MIVEVGTVVGIQDGMAQVEFIRKTMCGKCNQTDCGVQSLNLLVGKQRNVILEISTIEKLQIGAQVLVGIGAKDLLRAVMLLYGLPLLKHWPARM